jgi:hypothetical protein
MNRSMAADAVSDPTGRSCSDPSPETSRDRKWCGRDSPMRRPVMQPASPQRPHSPTYDTRPPTPAPYQFSKYLIPVFEGARDNDSPRGPPPQSRATERPPAGS